MERGDSAWSSGARKGRGDTDVGMTARSAEARVVHSDAPRIELGFERGDKARGDEARGDEARGDEARGDEARGGDAPGDAREDRDLDEGK